jgi:hypothetical protein
MEALVAAMDSAVVAVAAAITFSGSLPMVVIVALMAQNMMMLIAMAMQVVIVMLVFVNAGGVASAVSIADDAHPAFHNGDPADEHIRSQ